MSKLVEKKPNTDDDFELIAAINNGAPERFAELVARYEGRLYNFGVRMCGDVRDAEDMVQDTFLNAYRYLSGFRGETKFKNWLYRVATSACLKKKRKSKFAPERELSLSEFLPEEGEALPGEVPQWACAPLESLLNRELSDTLRNTHPGSPPKIPAGSCLEGSGGIFDGGNRPNPGLVPVQHQGAPSPGAPFSQRTAEGIF